MLEYQEVIFPRKKHLVAPIGDLYPSWDCTYCNRLIQLLCGFHPGARTHEVTNVFGLDQD